MTVFIKRVTFIPGTAQRIPVVSFNLDDRYSNLFLNAYMNRHAHTEYLKMI